MRVTLKEYKRLAETYDLVPVWRELLADEETPVSVLRRFAHHQNVFLLESMEGGETWGRYSLIGVDPENLLEKDHTQPVDDSLPLGLREIYQGVRAAPVPGLPRFYGGAVGFLAYEAITDFEGMAMPKVSAGRSLPISRFVRADNLVIFDNQRHTLNIVVCSRPNENGNVEEAYARAVARVNEMEAVLHRPLPPAPAKSNETVEFTSNMTPAAFKDMVMKARTRITNGEAVQIVVSQRFSAHTDVSPLQVYRALRFLNPSPYLFYFKTGGHVLVGSSPEVMMRISGRKVEVRPIAGTRPRGRTEQEDSALADELLKDEKERAEHIMLVDLGRNDIGRVAIAGSVQVRDLMVIERYSHVMHIVSHVEGLLRDGQDGVDALCVTFPAGTLSGAPKRRAMEIIHELEPEARGAYGGAIGYVSYDGSMDFAITIRTLEMEAGKVSVQAGAGVVYNSDPDREYEETCHKARGMRKAVELAAANLQLPSNRE